MGFTHKNRPTTRRHYAIEADANTNAPSLAGFLWQRSTTGRGRTETSIRTTGVNSYPYNQRGFTSSRSFTYGTSNTIESYTQDYSSGLTGSYSGTTSSYYRSDRGYQKSGAERSGNTGETESGGTAKYDQTVITGSATWTASRSSSASGEDTDGDIRIYSGSTSSSYNFESSYTQRRINHSKMDIVSSSSSRRVYGRTIKNDDGVHVTNTVDSGSNGTEYTYSFFEERYTVSTKKISSVKSEYITTGSTGTTGTYTYFSPEIGDTETSSYSLKTTTTVLTDAYPISIETFESETKYYNGFPRGSYGIYTIHGGAYYITDGEIFDGSILHNPVTGTVFTDSSKFLNDYVSYSRELYNGGAENNITSTRFDYYSSIYPYGIFTEKPYTAIYKKFVSGINSTLDFGQSTNVMFSYLSTVFSKYNIPSTSERVFNLQTTKTYQRDGCSEIRYSQIQPHFFTLETLSDIDGSLQAFTRSSTVSTFNTNASYSYGISVGSDRPGVGVSETTYVRIYYPFYSYLTQGRNLRANTLAIYTSEKFLNGGVQNQTSSDISGAVRGIPKISIQDQQITTVTLDSYDKQMGANSFVSQKYTGSAGFPLNFNFSLNRYLPFLPDEKYGDIYTEFNDMPCHLSFYENGKTLIKLTSTGEYFTSATFKSESETYTKESLKKTFSTALSGLIEIERGEEFEAGKSNILRQGFIGPNSYFDGGHVFFNKEGTFSQSGIDSDVFYVFGDSESKSIAVGGEGILPQTGTLPAGSMIFGVFNSCINTATRNGYYNATFDRYQSGDIYYNF